ncbi:ABC transporter ATP-binding protein (plasmid) [Rhizobium sp. B230/85]|uniref:dipeptide ABC transporter ATP-binding protein n=1 Tax=unclassified Rhizobium TaxID=2613769 RepID=UPI001ADD05B2|nr:MULTISPECIES: ABC transporter ATP-binding protein [unclassified Rhizobium]MBO9136732.1 ABC transporter ATP-binding protein [Rhizobium sp. B209b/85]QXZ99591.1 ABC transporter ATP-binding protein [Rhizobium sp. B230/85]
MTCEPGKTFLLQVKNLGLRHRSASGPVTILNDVSFALERGEILGIIGESGAGKSTLGNAVLGLLAPEFQVVSGTIEFEGKAIDAMKGQGDAIRGRRISAIFQDHTASLDPLMSVGAQVEETVLAIDGSISRREARTRAVELLARVGIPEPQRRYRNYPHQFSGGQRQRAVIAIALAGSPDIIIADEPTSALDATVQKQILKLLRALVDETGVSIILVTHDMGVVSEITDRVLIMRKGQAVEQDRTQVILDAPANDYTRSLLAAVPRLRISTAPVEAEANASRTMSSEGEEGDNMDLVAEGLSKSFSPKGLPWSLCRNVAKFALRDASIRLRRGQITGIVGESGSGKTTLGRIIAGLEVASVGRVTIGKNAFDVSKSGGRNGLLGRVQMVFQDPSVSLNPKMSVGETLRESIRFSADMRPGEDPADVGTMMDQLGLSRTLLARFPHQLSGGQKQRVCIARALLARPHIIIADEPTSALDVSVQAEIVKLLQDSIAEHDMTMIFISHDLAVVQQLCSSVYILKDGRVEDFGSSDFIFSQSQNPYTRDLVDARPIRFTC